MKIKKQVKLSLNWYKIEDAIFILMCLLFISAIVYYVQHASPFDNMRAKPQIMQGDNKPVDESVKQT